MTSAHAKFGPHGDRVAAFLEEVRATDKAGWHTFASLPREPGSGRRASAALREIRLSGPVQSAVHSAALAAFRSLELKADDLPDGYRIMAIPTAIDGAVRALAAGPDLAPEHREALLGEFERAGFTSVQADR
ncbi:MAG TPA: hypothetical protein VK028_08880 [Micromonosporaceae bacterium]|nr:hypothetical protein [Micromonosporaceae bacterium]